MTLSGWVDKYGRITAYTTAVIILTVFFIRFDTKFNQGNQQLVELNKRVSLLQSQVTSLQDLVRDREKYDRWRRMANTRLNRLYGELNWKYEDIE